MADRFLRMTAFNTFFQRFDDFCSFSKGTDLQTSVRSAIVFAYDDVLRNVYETACQVSGVGSFQCCIRKTFTGTVRGNEVLEYCQDRKSTRLNSSHVKNSYAVFCLKKKIAPPPLYRP